MLRLLDSPEHSHLFESCWSTLSSIPHSVLEDVQRARLERISALDEECRQLSYTLISTELNVLRSLDTQNCLMIREPCAGAAQERLLLEYLVRWQGSIFVPAQEISQLSAPPLPEQIHLVRRFEEILAHFMPQHREEVHFLQSEESTPRPEEWR